NRCHHGTPASINERTRSVLCALGIVGITGKRRNAGTVIGRNIANDQEAEGRKHKERREHTGINRPATIAVKGCFIGRTSCRCVLQRLISSATLVSLPWRPRS